MQCTRKDNMPLVLSHILGMIINTENGLNHWRILYVNMILLFVSINICLKVLHLQDL